MVWITYFIVLFTSVGGSLFALFKGDRPVRYGATLRLSMMALGLPLQYVLYKLPIPVNSWLAVYDLASTAIISFGFLFLALRYGSNWLAGAMVIQGFEFYTARIFLDSDAPNIALYKAQENIITTSVALVMIFATVAAIRGRQKQRQAAAIRDQKQQARMARIEALLNNQDTAAA
jgi:hypothetical protein